MKKITSVREMLVLNAYWVGLSFKWNALHPIILPALLLNYVPDAQKNTYLGLLTSAGLVLAAIVQPLAGMLSDGSRSRYGRRRPFMLVATLCDFFFLSVIGWARGLSWLFVGYIGVQISSNIGQSPAQALLPDRVAPEKVGAASGLKVFMDMLALILASLAAGRLLDPQGRAPMLALGAVMGVMLIATMITVLGTPEVPSNGQPEGSGRPTMADLRAHFHIDLHANPVYWRLIGQRFVFLLGVYGIQAFAQYYVRDVLKAANPIRETAYLLAALTAALTILAVTGGWLSDRFGAKRILYIAGILAAIGYVLLRLAPTPGMLIVYGSVVGAGIGLFLTGSWTLANKLAPAGEAGKYLGLTNLATAGAGALARLEGPLVDALNSARPGLWLGYTGLFALGTICALVSMLLLTRIPLEKTNFPPSPQTPLPLGEGRG